MHQRLLLPAAVQSLIMMTRIYDCDNKGTITLACHPTDKAFNPLHAEMREHLARPHVELVNIETLFFPDMIADSLTKAATARAHMRHTARQIGDQSFTPSLLTIQMLVLPANRVEGFLTTALQFSDICVGGPVVSPSRLSRPVPTPKGVGRSFASRMIACPLHSVRCSCRPFPPSAACGKVALSRPYARQQRM
jgi:hypothetical protein